ncbi:hypothetical protein ACS0TY_019748 [Phlomoides rotata]
MQRTTTFSRLGQTLLAATRGFCTSTSKSGGDEKIVASVIFERLPVVVSKSILLSMLFKNSRSDGDNNTDENTPKCS